MTLKFRGGWLFRHPPNTQFRLNTSSPQANGLVAWWPMMDSRGITGPVRDLVAGRFPMTQINSPTWVNDSQFGSCLLFDDASSEYIRYSGGIVGSPPFTISAWFRIDAAAATQVVYCESQQFSGQFWRLYIDGNDLRLYWHVKGVGHAICSTANNSISLNTWQHGCAIEAASNDHVLFLDGSNRDTNADDQSPTNIWGTGIGARYDNVPDGFISGRITDIRVYNRVLSDAEVYQLYDPATRWELYQPMARMFVVVKPVAAVDLNVNISRANRDRWKSGIVVS